MPLQIEHRPVDGLTPYARNARTHSPEQVAAIAGSIAEFGFVNPVLVDRQGTVIAGHGRLLAAQQLGLTEVPVVTLEHLSDVQRRALTLADNRIAEQAGWDDAVLAAELQRLADEDFDLRLAGFDASDLDELLAGLEDPTPDNDSADEIPDPPERPVSRSGDIWCLGRHRIICGDAGDPAVVAAVTEGRPARLCFTSPPYASQRNYTTGGIDDWDALMQGVFAALPMAPDGQVLVNLGLVHRENEVQFYWSQWLEWMRSQGWRRFGWYVWDQGPGMPGDWNGRLAPAFEFIFHFNRESRRPHKTVPCKHAGQESHLRADGSSTAMRDAEGNVGGWVHAGRPTQETRIPDAVLRIMRHKGKIGQDIDHPAVFPVALPRFVMEAYSDPGDLCFEPFGGSGTSILAAEQCGRTVCAVELAPEYVDVAIKRWQQVTGQPATHATTGESFPTARDS